MKKIKLFLFAAMLLGSVGLHASNTITYTATEQLLGYSSSLNVGKTTFGPAITSHTFSNGTGVITCDGEITKIGDYAFYYCTGLTSITIPNSVTTIGNNVFYNCTGLTAVEIPNSVTTIGDYAFYYCIGFTSITIPNSVTTIGSSAFGYCSGLTSVTIPNSVKTIGDYAFNSCSGLTSITIPNSVTTIGNGAFNKCSGLTSITIPNSVTTIGSSAFYACSGLTSVTIGNSVKTIENAVFERCSSLISITIPNSVTTIGNQAFRSCTSLTSIAIPNSVTTIGSSAFGYCSGLTSVTIPNSVTRIGDEAFYYCSGLTSVTVSWIDEKSIPSINSNVFGEIAHGFGLAEATLHVPNGTAALYQQVNGWKEFGSIIEVLNTITYSATSRLSRYDGSLDVGATTFGPAIVSHEFSNGTGTITCSGEIGKIGYKAFEGCTRLISIEIPNSVYTIAGYAFSDCSSLTSITIPNSVTTIGDIAFHGCSGLNSITIPNSVTSIGVSAFSDCSSLTSITIPNSVTTIGDYAFARCTGLTSVTVSWTDEKSIPSIYSNSNVFLEIAHGAGTNGAKLYVPYGTKELYQQAEVWKTFGDIESDIVKIDDLWYRLLNVRTVNLIANQYTRIPYSGDVVIPKTIIYDDGNTSIAAIEDSAFYNAKLTSLTVLTDFPLPCSEHTFTGQNKSIPLYVLDVPAFQSAKYWKEFTNILFYQPYKEAAKKKVQDIVNGIPSQYASLAKPIADNYFQNIENVNTIRQVDDLTARTLKKLQVFYDQGLWIKSGDYWLLKGKELLK